MPRKVLLFPAALAALLAFAPAQASEPISFSTVRVPLSWDDETATRAGRLDYRGGIELRADHEGFGGLSGLRISEDGAAFLAVSDRGWWVDGRLIHDAAGRLVGAEDGRIAAMLGKDGRRLRGNWADAEAVAFRHERPGPMAGVSERIWPEVLVAFERRDRIWAYDIERHGFAALPVEIGQPEGIDRLIFNKGIEGLAVLDKTARDGVRGEADRTPLRVLAISEATPDANRDFIGWIREDGAWHRLGLVPRPPFELTDLVADIDPPGGRRPYVYALERRYSLVAGPGMRIRRFPLADVAPGARLEGEALINLNITYTIDNMEGIALRYTDEGETLLYVISDDNYSRLQRTLILMFAVID
jgi:hypothetical protein